MLGLPEFLILSAICIGLPLYATPLLLALLLLKPGHRKVCPYCTERIRANARVCRYCGRELESEQDERGGRDGEESSP